VEPFATDLTDGLPHAAELLHMLIWMIAAALLGVWIILAVLDRVHERIDARRAAGKFEDTPQ